MGRFAHQINYYALMAFVFPSCEIYNLIDTGKTQSSSLTDVGKKENNQ